MESKIIQDNEIDLVALSKTIWNGRKIIFNSAVFCLLAGLLILIVSPKKYSASAILLHSSEEGVNKMGGLGAIAGMAGINIGSMMGNSSSLPTEIFPQVLDSYPFVEELMNERFDFEEYDEPVSIYDYVMADTVQTFGDKFLKYTVLLPWTIKCMLKPEGGGIGADYGVIKLTEQEQGVVDWVKGVLDLSVDKESQLISITTEVEEPILAAQLIQKTVSILQQYVVDYKTKQAQENLRFIEGRYKEKKKEYETLQLELLEYKDMHRNLVSERVGLEIKRLEDDYDIAASVYKSLAQQLEQARITVKEETPTLIVIEPPKVPLLKSSPQTKIVLAISIFLGVFVGIGIILGKVILNKVKEKFR